MRILLIVPFLLVALAPAQAAAQNCGDPRAQREVTRLKGELDTQAVECSVAARGDLDGDRRADAVLVIGWEGAGGGNNWGSTLYVLLANGRAPLVQEPDETRGTLDSVTVAGRTIRASTYEYREGDGRCCPSGRGQFILRLDGRRLVRVPPE
ncbi:hypothetical protein [Longimicrobium sp.]|uniref:hypothetical protein n=1 Tax=Longimicrobium sp. TaxID=2029185 RepID=UPI003B3AA592